MGLFNQNETHGLHVKNYAILMFSTHPERFIPHSDIEVIADTYGDESRMVAKTFTGPIWKQYYACLKYIQDFTSDRIDTLSLSISSRFC